MRSDLAGACVFAATSAEAGAAHALELLRGRVDVARVDEDAGSVPPMAVHCRVAASQQA